jgi:hypothetical protein
MRLPTTDYSRYVGMWPGFQNQVGWLVGMESGSSVGTAKKSDSLHTLSGSLEAFLEGHPHKPSKHPLRIKPSPAI